MGVVSGSFQTLQRNLAFSDWGQVFQGERMAAIRKDPARHPLRKQLLKVELLPYQLEGIAFAAGVGRAILADDMGLGKTIQGVGTAEILAQEAGIRKVLVVCPATLKSQWRSEIRRFCRRSVQLVVGGAAERARQYDNESFFSVCNYEQVPRKIRDAAARQGAPGACRHPLHSDNCGESRSRTTAECPSSQAAENQRQPRVMTIASGREKVALSVVSGSLPILPVFASVGQGKTQARFLPGFVHFLGLVARVESCPRLRHYFLRDVTALTDHGDRGAGQIARGQPGGRRLEASPFERKSRGSC